MRQGQSSLLHTDGHTVRYRLKKVQGKKKRDAAAADAEKALKDAAAAAEAPAPDTVEGSTDLLSSKDEDVIF